MFNFEVKLKETRRIEREHADVKGQLTDREKNTVTIITKMYRQQKNHFQSGDIRESVPNRIVSISKPYIRPIVRGKETKNVEFGAKVNHIQVDGISFIEKLSFNTFSEGTRLKHYVSLHKRLFGVDVKKIGGDIGYAGTLVSREQHSDIFCAKRKACIRKERARLCKTGTRSGQSNSHGGILRDTEGTLQFETRQAEIMYLFFGIHTANIVQLADRIVQKQQAKAA